MFRKKRLYVLGILFICLPLLFLIQGCSKDLDLTPDGRVTLDDIFGENRGTLNYLNSAYDHIPPRGDFYYWITFLAGITDDAFDSDITESYVMATQWYEGGLTPNSNPIFSPEGFVPSYQYENLWQGIRKCNIFLDRIDEATLNEGANRSRLKGEAHTLRAFFYFQLIKAYGGMPIFDEPIPDEFNYAKLERESFEKCVQFIVEDCDAALASPGLPWRVTKDDEQRRFTKAVALALKSQATLYNASPLWNEDNNLEKWKMAADASKDAIEQLEANGFELYGNYGEYFLRLMDYNANPSDKESFHEGSTFWHYPIGNQMPLPGVDQVKAGVCPSQELVDAYDMKSTGEPAILGYNDADHLDPIINPNSGYDPENPYKDRDPRFYTTVWYNGAMYGELNGQPYELQIFKGGAQGIQQNVRNYTQTGYYLRKYIDSTIREGEGAKIRMKTFRLAEVYLNYAEAENEANGPSQPVYDAVNKVRNRVGMPDLPQGLTKEELRKRIRNERRVEFPVEEMRFWDVRRWKILDQVDKVVTGMEWVKNPDNTFSNHRILVYRKKAWQDKFLIFPIPTDELAKMPLFGQNFGW